MSFVKGLDLAERFYGEAVGPILAQQCATLVYSAALIGEGSEVIGFDTPQSTDHGWGPRLMLFLSEADYHTRSDEIDRVLRHHLPPEVAGYPTNFGSHDDGSLVMHPVDAPPINHGVILVQVRAFFQRVLHFDPTAEIRAADWVSVPDHRLLSLTSGRVFFDGLGALEPLRTKLCYYPRDVWLYLLAAQWRRIAQEEAFMGRCGQVDDDLGSRLVAARLVRDLMRLCFLMERRYAPYIKWFGSAFARLDCAPQLLPTLTRVLVANSWQERQAHLMVACELVAAMHNALSITAPLSESVSRFHDRPFLVIHADRFVDAIRARIESEEVLALPDHLGSVDQFVDSTDAWSELQRIGRVYRDTGVADMPS